jgi:hypothetical protein
MNGFFRKSNSKKKEERLIAVYINHLVALMEVQKVYYRLKYFLSRLALR